MRKWFAKGGKDPDLEAIVQQDLINAQRSLKALRNTRGQDFPLLNECIRHVQQVAEGITQLPDNDRSKLLKEQLAVLQKELNKITDRMMTRTDVTSAGTPGASLFDGLSLGGDAPKQTTLIPAADVFNGNFLGNQQPGKATKPPAEREKVEEKAVKKHGKEDLSATTAELDTLPNLLGSPLPEHLFSNLSEIHISTESQADPFVASKGPKANEGQKARKKISQRIGMGRQAGPSETGNLIIDATLQMEPASTNGARDYRDNANSALIPDLMDGLPTSTPLMGHSDFHQADTQHSHEQKIQALLRKERSAAQTRRDLLKQLHQLRGDLTQAQFEEAKAAEEEEFEKAGVLSQKIVNLKARQLQLQANAQQIEAEISFLVKQRWQCSEEQIDKWKRSKDVVHLEVQNHTNRAESASNAATQFRERAEDIDRDLSKQEDLHQQNLARQQSEIQEKQFELAQSVQEAAGPFVSQKEEQEVVALQLKEEISALRSKLVEKEGALQEVMLALTNLDAKIQSATSRFDIQKQEITEGIAQIASNERALKYDMEERMSQKADLLRQAEEAGNTAREASKEAAECLKRSEESETALKDLLTNLSNEKDAFERESKVRDRLDSSISSCQAAEKNLEASRSEVQSLRGEWTSLKLGIKSVEEGIASARQRLPEIEIGKRRAASSKDFKEAARLSSEAKDLTLKIEKQTKWLGKLKEQEDSMHAQESSILEAVSQREIEVKEMEGAVMTARMELLKVQAREMEAKLKAAQKIATNAEDISTLESDLLMVTEELKSLGNAEENIGAGLAEELPAHEEGQPRPESTTGHEGQDSEGPEEGDKGREENVPEGFPTLISNSPKAQHHSPRSRPAKDREDVPEMPQLGERVSLAQNLDKLLSQEAEQKLDLPESEEHNAGDSSSTPNQIGTPSTKQENADLLDLVPQIRHNPQEAKKDLDTEAVSGGSKRLDMKGAVQNDSPIDNVLPDTEEDSKTKEDANDNQKAEDMFAGLTFG